MTEIQISASRTYDVVIGRGLLSQAGQRIAPLIRGRNAVIISDSNVFSLYGNTVQNSLKASGFAVNTAIFTAGEENKNPQTLLELLNQVGGFGLTRSDVIVALGGGVVGDMGGLCAALYLRGIPCVQIPTSLLAMVDSSVGGKTAVNLDSGKNQMGTFTQPHLVLCDLDCLQTLTPQVYAEGMAEIIKYGMIASQPLLNQLLHGTMDGEIEDVVAQCISIKRDVVATDERDVGERQILNFGHTVGHAIEALAHYEIYHGEGVAMGMAIVTRGAVALGMCHPQCLTTLETLLTKYNLPQHADFSVDSLHGATMSDKKRGGKGIILILPSQLGQCTLHQTDDQLLRQLIQAGCQP